MVCVCLCVCVCGGVCGVCMCMWCVWCVCVVYVCGVCVWCVYVCVYVCVACVWCVYVVCVWWCVCVCGAYNIRTTRRIHNTLLCKESSLTAEECQVSLCLNSCRRRKPYLVMEESSSSNMSSSFAMFSLTTMRTLGVRAAVARLKKETKSSERMKSGDCQCVCMCRDSTAIHICSITS